jgi:mono/diheme cytochrome c family protein
VHEEHLDDNMVARTRSLAQVTFFFTVSTLGLSPARAPENLEHVADVMEFTTHYTPPPFPGVVDATRAARGQKLYVAQCQSCHGTFEERDGRMVLTSFPNIIVPQAAMGSDDARWRSVDSDAIVALRKSPIGKTVDIASTGGYVAMTLTGAWASAPYMHNGSVPTLWDFLHPAERPKRFLVGGHRLDFKKLGIDQHIDASGAPAYPDGYVPWSTPALYDATTPGRTNSGHEAQFAGLSEDDKSDLLEFMKRL